MRAEQTVSEMVVEVLARQAEELAGRSGLPFWEALEAVRRTEAGGQLCELLEGPHRHEKASHWQANLPYERVSEQALDGPTWAAVGGQYRANAVAPTGRMGRSIDGEACRPQETRVLR